MKNKILIYGASGYTGKLFTAIAAHHNMPIVLGGRSSIESIHPTTRFSLEDQATIKQHLEKVKLVVNLAGPFSLTHKPLIEACIETRTHYIDIAGEYPEFEAAYTYHKHAIEAGVMLLPGSGFGVVPTDIAAKLAQDLLPDADTLIISYVTKGGASRGTLQTILKDITKPGIQVVNGNRKTAKPAATFFNFVFKNKSYHTVYNPWRADLFTAYLSTGIKNIQTYANFPGFVVKMMRNKLRWLRTFLLNTAIKWLPEGPTKKQLEQGSTLVMAKATNKKGVTKEVFIEGPEAYLFTVEILLETSKRIMLDQYKPGFQTPSMYGKELILNIQNVNITTS